ncbi:MAG: MarR family transcriptional regulator [Dehalococcoidia bacterium]|nr:MarR family transcriptional regulator [Dehalococcoidia bacterium]
MPAADRTVLAVHRTFTYAHTLAHAHLTRQYARVGLSIPRFNVLRLLHHAPDGHLTMRQLSAFLAVSPPNITKLVDGLEKEDWVARSIVPKDRRSTYITLTERGERDFIALLPNVVDVWADMWSPLNADERLAFAALLQKFAAQFD